MANGGLGWFNLFDGGVITADTESAVAPVSNLTLPQGGYPWMSEFGTTTANIYLDSQDAVSTLQAGTNWPGSSASWGLADFTYSGNTAIWRAVGVFRTNLTKLATIRYRLGTTPGGSDVLDTGDLTGVEPGRNQHIYVHPTHLVARYLTITITDTSNPDNQLKVGLAYGGNMVIPQSNFGFSSSSERENRLDIAVSAGGFEYPKYMWQRRKWNISWDDLSQTEIRSYLDTIDSYARKGYNVLFVPDYEDGLNFDSVYGMLREPSPFSFARAGFSRYAWAAQITERL